MSSGSRTLARKGFYNGVVFHRVIEGFMAQTGDPTGTGKGGSELPDLKAEFNGAPACSRHRIGRSHQPSRTRANSQFFIIFTPRFSLDGKYTVFGRVVTGMQYVDAIERGEPPATPSRIVKASIGADNVPPPTPAEVAAAMQRPRLRSRCRSGARRRGSARRLPEPHRRPRQRQRRPPRRRRSAEPEAPAAPRTVRKRRRPPAAMTCASTCSTSNFRPTGSR